MASIPEGMKHLLDLAKTVNDARADFVAGIRTIREHIQQWKLQREATLAIPVTLDVAEERIEQWVDQRVDAAVRNLMGNYEKPPSPEVFTVAPTKWVSPEAAVLTLMARYLRDDLGSILNLGC